MPIYEYQCQKCKKVHEIWQKISEAPLKTCPDCKGKMDRLISASGFQLKGSGWYVSDYQRKGGSREKKTEEKKAEGESKPAEKKDSSDSKKDSKDSKKKSDEPAAGAATTTPGP